MLRTVLWIAAACAAVLLALAVSRYMKFDQAPEAPKAAPEVVEPKTVEEAKPVEAPKPPEAKLEVTPDELQIQEDAAATGMTTVEPEEPPPADPPQ